MQNTEKISLKFHKLN